MTDEGTSDNPLAASALFTLATFAHAALFEGTIYAWETLERIRSYLEALGEPRVLGTVDDRAYLVGVGIHIAESAVVEPGAYVRGPCIIGRNSQVRHGAYLRGNVVIGEGCVVGHATEVKSSILLDGAKAGHFAYVGDSILGNDANLGAGTKLANLRLDGAEIVVQHVPT